MAAGHSSICGNVFQNGLVLASQGRSRSWAALVFEVACILRHGISHLVVTNEPIWPSKVARAAAAPLLPLQSQCLYPRLPPSDGAKLCTYR